MAEQMAEEILQNRKAFSSMQAHSANYLISKMKS